MDRMQDVMKFMLLFYSPMIVGLFFGAVISLFETLMNRRPDALPAAKARFKTAPKL